MESPRRPVRQWTPFNSEDFKEFAAEMGFKHKKITPQHPKAQGQVEGFNKLMNKTAAIAHAEGIDLHEATYDILQQGEPAGLKQSGKETANIKRN